MKQMIKSQAIQTSWTKLELNEVLPHLTGQITDYLKVELLKLIKWIEELETRMHNPNTNKAEYTGCYTTFTALALICSLAMTNAD